MHIDMTSVLANNLRSVLFIILCLLFDVKLYCEIRNETFFYSQASFRSREFTKRVLSRTSVFAPVPIQTLRLFSARYVSVPRSSSRDINIDPARILVTVWKISASA